MNYSDKLLSNDVIKAYLKDIKEIKYGDDYCGKKFLIIRTAGPFGGLGAIVLSVAKGIKYARRNGYIPVVDMQTYETQYMEDEEYGKINAYTKFFEQPDKYDVCDIEHAKSVSFMYDSGWFSQKPDLNIPIMKPELYAKYCEFSKKFKNKKVLGVLFRGTDYANLKPYGHEIQPDLFTMLNTVKEKMLEWGGFDLIYLCTEVQEACEKFENEFGKNKVFYYPQLRYKSDTKDYLTNITFDTKSHTEQGKAYLIALNCLALCNSIVAGQCRGTTVALLINKNRYKNKYLFKLGKYGIDTV